MAVDGGRALPNGAEPGAWRRLLTWLGEVGAAMDVSYDEIQDRRILALEHEVARLGALLAPPPGPTPPYRPDQPSSSRS